MIHLIHCVLSLVATAEDSGGNQAAPRSPPAFVLGADSLPVPGATIAIGQPDAQVGTTTDPPLREELTLLEDDRRVLKSLMVTSDPEAEHAADEFTSASRQLRETLAEMVRELDARKQRPRVASRTDAGTSAQTPTAKPTARDGVVKGAVDSSRMADQKMTMTGGTVPVDPVALGQVLMRMGDYEGAVRAYRAVELAKQRPGDRAYVQYLLATCLRKLGRTQEALPLYREVANNKVETPLAECARWQLAMLDWRKTQEARLADIRQRRMAIEAMLESAGTQTPEGEQRSGAQ
jgi:tetratricopeptide (TPR) repeat protein